MNERVLKRMLVNEEKLRIIRNSKICVKKKNWLMKESKMKKKWVRLRKEGNMEKEWK